MITEIEKREQNTPLGQIPTDWVSTIFENVIEKFSSGATPYRRISEYYSGNNLWVSSSELNYGIINDTKEKITDEAIRKTNLHKHPEGTFLIAITGLEAAGTRGRCGILGQEAATNQSCMALYPKSEKLETEYLFYFYQFYGDYLAFNYCQGTKQQSYTARIVRILPINLPPTLTEQQAIAEALSDVDELIRSLDRLIEKKEAIKQGTMQQLLTGKTRLPGFDGEWEVKKLGEFVDVDPENLSSSTNPDYEFEYLSLEDVNRGVIKSKTKLRYADSPSRARRVLRVGDVGFGTVRPTNQSHFLIENKVDDLICSTGFAVMRPQSKVMNSEYLFYSLFTNQIDEQVIQIIAGSNYPAVNSSDVKNLKLNFPTDIEEQKAITQILSDMDKELQALRGKRDKYKQVKQGMMQELLTGKTRLV